MSERKVSTDALETLGMVHTREEQRDAIHLAVAPVEAAVRLFPGQHIGVLDGVASPSGKLLGIVDPFLSVPVEPGQKFWFVMYPRMVTSLRHVWSHPDFADEHGIASNGPNKSASETWLRNFIATADCPDYETVIAAAIDNRNTWDSDYLHFDGYDAHGEIPPEFWTHVEIVTGRQIAAGDRAKHFSCSC